MIFIITPMYDDDYIYHLAKTDTKPPEDVKLHWEVQTWLTHTIYTHDLYEVLQTDTSCKDLVEEAKKLGEQNPYMI